MKHKLIDLLIACDEVRLQSRDLMDWVDVNLWCRGIHSETEQAYLEAVNYEDRYDFTEAELVELDLQGCAVATLRDWADAQAEHRRLKFLRVVPLTDSDVKEEA
jgi:hypothetical protein